MRCNLVHQEGRGDQAICCGGWISRAVFPALTASHKTPRALRRRSQICSEIKASLNPPATATEIPSKLQGFRATFKEWDTDGDGCLDKVEFRELLQQVVKGLQPFTIDWLKEVELEEVVFSYDENKDGKISLSELDVLIQDCSIVEGKLHDYRAIFDAIDSSGDGTLNGGEITQLFKAIGQPIQPSKLAKLMETVDRDMNGRLDFLEFIGIFRHELLDLQKIADFVRMRHVKAAPARPQKLVEATPGEVLMFFSEAEFDYILQSHAHQLVVLEAGLSWCRPCKGFERTFQKFAGFYDQAIFLRFYGNSNETCRHLFSDRVQAAATPDFTFYRDGELLHRFTGANASKLNQAMQTLLKADENPLHAASHFQRQVWNSSIGVH